MRNVVNITRVTGHVIVNMPTRRSCAEEPICNIKCVQMRVHRVGLRQPLATYPAIMQDGNWVFVIDDVFRKAKPGMYSGVIYCSNKPIHTITMRLLRDLPGDVTTLDLTHDACPSNDCPVEPECCPPEPPQCAPCYAAVGCQDNCPPLPTGCTPPGPEGNCSIHCNPSCH